MARRSPTLTASAPALDMPRLAEAMQSSRQALQYFRTQRYDAVQQYVGAHWSENGADKIVPLNLLAKYVQTIGRALCSKNPRVMYSTMNGQIRAQVAAMQDWMNAHVEEIYFAETVQRWVFDALFCVGIMKVGIATPDAAQMRGYQTDAGLPFADVVDLDDFVFDIGAKRFTEASFVGHRFRIPYETAVNLKYFSASARSKLTPSANRSVNQEGDERITRMGRDYAVTDEDEYEEFVELWELYLPRKRLTVTFAATDGEVPTGDIRPLRVDPWLGPKCGPYHFLALMPVPGNAMPLGPVMNLVDLADLVNRLYRKVGAQADRQKEVLPVSGGQMDDGKRLKQARDGEMFQCDDPGGIKPVSYGGPSPANVQFAIHTADLFNKQAGNLDLLTGSGPQSKTASQDKMLNENAGAGVADYQETVVSGVAGVFRSYGFWYWHHPELVMKTQVSVPGLPEFSATRELHPKGTPGKLSRDGDFADLQIRVDPYSMQFKSPAQRLANLDQTMALAQPLLPLLQQQGVVPDFQFYLKKRAEYTDEPDLVQLFTIQEPIAPASGGDGERMPAETSREYVRRSVGQDTKANQEADMMNELSAETGNSIPT